MSPQNRIRRNGGTSRNTGTTERARNTLLRPPPGGGRALCSGYPPPARPAGSRSFDGSRDIYSRQKQRIGRARGTGGSLMAGGPPSPPAAGGRRGGRGGGEAGG